MGTWMRSWTAKVLGIGLLALMMLLPLCKVQSLVEDQYALLIGAVVLVLTLALLMYLTRRIDWYASVPAALESAAAIMGRP